MAPRVGVLVIQGDFEKHLAMLAAVGAEGVLVLRKDDLDGLDALILPGGESTTISKGLARLELAVPIQDFARSGHAVLGTCASVYWNWCARSACASRGWAPASCTI